MKKKLKIKDELIGAKVFHKNLNKNILVEEGKEDFYEKIGLNVFETPETPKLKKDAKKTTKKRKDESNSNSNGAYDSK